ncbi:MAG: hypothetical protein L0209_10820, partial [candidate division Zixibacteria bacterium]|nr:hypothetical protein [candidate division Zixibacteria bacterium]
MVENAPSRAPGYWLFRKIPDIPTARKIGRLGFWAAAYMAVTIAVFAVPKKPLQVMDLIPYVLVAVGIWKLWRTAAILGLCWETYEAVWMWMRHRMEMEILDWIHEVILILLFIM